MMMMMMIIIIIINNWHTSSLKTEMKVTNNKALLRPAFL
jgi:hypothetical protein